MQTHKATGAFMVLLMAMTLLARATDFRGFELASYFAAGMLYFLCWRLIAFREIYLLGVCALLSGLAFFVFDMPLAVYEAAFAQASFLMAFLLLLALLHETAMTSPTISECGHYLTKQPPKQRYLAIFSGTNLMAVLFNLGIVSLLTPLIKKGVRDEATEPAIAALRERRQLTALLRGFSWGVVWSPTAMAPLAVMELIDGISRELWTAYGLICTAAILCVGWLEDIWRFRKIQRSPAAKRNQPAFPKAAILRFLLVLFSLFTITIAVSVWADDTIVFGLLVACPVIMLGWLTAQNWGKGRARFSAAAQQAIHICHRELPHNGRIIFALSASGYIGRLSAEMVPIDFVATLIARYAMPDYLFLTMMAFIMVPVSYLGVSPIMMAVFFGSILGALPVLPVDPTLAALAISSGWALSMTTSPFATVVLMVSNLSGARPLRLSIGWNTSFSALALVTLSMVFFILTGGR
jgi:hypothetical protein